MRQGITRNWVCSVILASGGAVSVLPGAESNAPLNYDRDVRPILSENCFYCHGQDNKKRMAGLRLDSAYEELAVPKASGRGIGGLLGSPKIAAALGKPYRVPFGGYVGMQWASDVAQAFILMQPGNAIVYMNGKEFGDGRDFPKDGFGDALGGQYGDTITKLIEARNTHGRAITSEEFQVVLDDALVYSDDDRFARVFSALREASTHHQVIILTCRAAQAGGRRPRAVGRGFRAGHNSFKNSALSQESSRPAVMIHHIF